MHLEGSPSSFIPLRLTRLRPAASQRPSQPASQPAGQSASQLAVSLPAPRTADYTATLPYYNTTILLDYYTTILLNYDATSILSYILTILYHTIPYQPVIFSALAAGWPHRRARCTLASSGKAKIGSGPHVRPVSK